MAQEVEAAARSDGDVLTRGRAENADKKIPALSQRQGRVIKQGMAI